MYVNIYIHEPPVRNKIENVHLERIVPNRQRGKIGNPNASASEQQGNISYNISYNRVVLQC